MACQENISFHHLATYKEEFERDEKREGGRIVNEERFAIDLVNKHRHQETGQDFVASCKRAKTRNKSDEFVSLDSVNEVELVHGSNRGNASKLC